MSRIDQVRIARLLSNAISIARFEIPCKGSNGTVGLHHAHCERASPSTVKCHRKGTFMRNNNPKAVNFLRALGLWRKLHFKAPHQQGQRQVADGESNRTGLLGHLPSYGGSRSPNRAGTRFRP